MPIIEVNRDALRADVAVVLRALHFGSKPTPRVLPKWAQRTDKQLTSAHGAEAARYGRAGQYHRDALRRLWSDAVVHRHRLLERLNDGDTDILECGPSERWGFRALAMWMNTLPDAPPEDGSATKEWKTFRKHCELIADHLEDLLKYLAEKSPRSLFGASMPAALRHPSAGVAACRVQGVNEAAERLGAADVLPLEQEAEPADAEAEPIPLRYQSIPMTKKRAAELYNGSKISNPTNFFDNLIKNGAIRPPMRRGNLWVFDIRDFPESAAEQIRRITG